MMSCGAFPNEVTERVQRDGFPTVIGNYDDGVGFDRDDCGCAYRDPDERERGQRSLMWTRAQRALDIVAKALLSRIRLWISLPAVCERMGVRASM